MVLSLERWIGKVAIITGANFGIDEATAKRLVEEGINVVGVDKNIEKIEENAKSLASATGKLYAIKADLTQEEQILNAFRWTSENVGPVAILINNAGTIVPSSMINGATEDWKVMLDVNVLALCIATREAIKIMREHSIDGHIVNICSINGHKVIAGRHTYSATKFAVKAVTETLRLEVNALKSKIKVGCVSPGMVRTGMTTNFLQAEESKGTVYPFLNPEDIADGIVYALSTPAHVQCVNPGMIRTGMATNFLQAEEAKGNVYPFLNPEDIADAIVYVLSTPPHVQIQELLITPVGEFL